MNEQEQFLKDLEPKEGDGQLNHFEDSSTVEAAQAKTDEKDEEEAPEDVKNRAHRRLESKLRAEREANIAMAARLETLSEAKKFQAESEPSEHLKSVERIYGMDSPEGVAATELLKSALAGVQKKATDDALSIFREEQRKAAEAVKNEEKALDSMLEEIEDEYGVDLTSAKSEEMRKGFLKRLQKLSPKDADGNILHFADPMAVWEDFQSKIPKKTENRAKDIGSRSMVQSNATDTTKAGISQMESFLKEQGII